MSLDGKFIVSGGKDAALRLYDAQTAKVIFFYYYLFINTFKFKIKIRFIYQ